jgi:putative tricarboxylic transport membrane protein
MAAGLYALSLPLGTFAQPGSGLWPLIVSIVLTVCALLLLVTENDPSDYESAVARTVVAVFGFLLLAAFIVGFQFVGLTIPSLVLIFVWLRWLAGEPWRLALLVSIGATALFVTVFVVLLSVPVPNDPIVSLLTGRGF